MISQLVRLVEQSTSSHISQPTQVNSTSVSKYRVAFQNNAHLVGPTKRHDVASRLPYFGSAFMSYFGYFTIPSNHDVAIMSLVGTYLMHNVRGQPIGNWPLA